MPVASAVRRSFAVCGPNVRASASGAIAPLRMRVPSASGQMVVINTDAAGPLMAAGVNRQALRIGTVLTIKGYPARDGSRLYADPADMAADGRPLAKAATAGLPELVSRRLATCGDMPTREIIPPGTTMPDPFVGWPAAEKAEAVEALTQFLTTTGALPRARLGRKAIAEGKAVFHRVGCVA